MNQTVLNQAEINHTFLSAGTKPLAPRQVLVVDDDAGMRAALEISFLRHGWRVETAAARLRRWRSSGGGSIP
jgi:PleD family two-component response regulator